MYDVIIIGSGPAGLSAAIYACRSNLKTLVIENETFGGKLSKIHEIDNYPGTPNINGGELASNLYNQANAFNAEIINGQVSKIIDGEIKKVVLDNNEEKETKSIIIATGTSITTLNIDKAKEYIGRGISYCATCDGFFYRKKDVAVLGDKNEAVEEALYLSSLANKVYIISKRKSLLAVESNMKKLQEANNIEIIYEAIPDALVIEEDIIKGLTIKDVSTNNIKTIDCVGIFPYIGTRPNTDFIDSSLLDEEGYLIVDETMKTKIDGIYGAGDVLRKELRQVVTACSDGAIAASSIKKNMKK